MFWVCKVTKSFSQITIFLAAERKKNFFWKKVQKNLEDNKKIYYLCTRNLKDSVETTDGCHVESFKVLLSRSCSLRLNKFLKKRLIMWYWPMV